MCSSDLYTLAGKTGTAAKLVGGRYSKSDYNASFVGLVPSRNPAAVVLVVIDSPHGQGTTGGAVSAPVFRRIAEATLRYYGIQQTINPPPPVLVAKDTSGAADTEAQVVAMSGTLSPSVTLAAHEADTVPNLLGQSAREAVRTLARAGLVARLSGDGVVTHQDPPPGAPLELGGVCRLQLSRTSAGTATLAAATVASEGGPRP